MSKPAVTRTERGLVVTGTRITLYQLVDYREAGWTPKLIAVRLGLDEDRVAGVMAWMADNQVLVAREHAEIVARDEAIRTHWDETNASKLAQLGTSPDALRAKLKQRIGATSP